MTSTSCGTSSSCGTSWDSCGTSCGTSYSSNCDTCTTVKCKRRGLFRIFGRKKTQVCCPTQNSYVGNWSTPSYDTPSYGTTPVEPSNTASQQAPTPIPAAN